ncbi:pentatricopeptide repeat-containing protein At1g74630 [Magnolia sinica]|uniref:pentatricopeptide repeat-containing protein At1g74630 n=1 Tax=Magnolia sinica TaxID=86752 RepID=UPI00265A9D20|nr:pentatricopeptide repeat-containing protein At1g74630 [Magnolia sinica]
MSSSSLQLCLSSLKACKTISSLKQIHAYALKTSLDSDPFIAGQLLLLSTATVADAIDYARRIFVHIPGPDAFMYNTLIRGLSDSESPQQSFLTYTQMRRCSVTPDSFSFAFILKAAANFKSLNTGIQLHCQAINHGFNTHLFVQTTLVSMYAECRQIDSAQKAFEETPQPNVVAWNAIVTACFRCDDVMCAESLFNRMPWRNLTSWNLMLAGYMKAGEMESARRTFCEMPQTDPVSWSTMIVGFAHNGCFDDAFGFFREMQRLGTRPNEVSLTGVLSACAQAGAFDFGKILHGYIEKAGFCGIVSVSNALLDTYAKCGNIGMARLVFNWMMEKKTIVSWTSMIAGLAMYGHGEEAIDLFQKMEESGTRPDGVTFISILYACSHAGLVEQGSLHFHKMEEIYGIKPSVEHYGCMVDIYGRAGLLDKAYEFVKRMPIEPNAVIWRTLLGACSIHGNVRLAEHVKKKLSSLDPDNSGDHVLLSNIYAVAGKWKDVASVRRLMTDRKIKKTPGWSMIEVDKEFYRFVVGDGGNSATKEALEKLGEIILRLKVEGYIPEIGSVLHDIEEEEKGDAVSRHSEKLAVAFGMARLCEGSVIRIVKNLRVCVDCHLVMKLISKVYRREIVVRDRSRFHSFKDGSCSCQDYW